MGEGDGFVAFYIPDNGNQQNDKQYLNLSPLAFYTIQNDMFSFGCKLLSTFVNRVFSNFYAEANASISIVLSRKREEWLRTLSSLTNKEDAVEKLIVAEKNRLQQKALNYPKGHGKKIRLNKENFTYLTSANSTCHEEDYYQRGGQGECMGWYIKAVLEEYARKSFFEREAIFFRDHIELISDAIVFQKQLKITIQNGAQFFVKPCSIDSDKQSTYHYLIGLSYPVDQDETAQAAHSFRISRIKDITLYRSRSGFLSASQKNMLYDLIAKKGAPFVGSNEETIRVCLTEQGKQMYKDILHMRPTYISCEGENNDIFVFECSPFQIKNYFRLFGEHAKILSPASLVEEFRCFYEAARNNYASTSDNA